MQSVNEMDLKREELLTQLYLEAFPLTASFVKKMGGQLEDAREIFQEAIIIYYEQVLSAQKKTATSHQAYLLGISRHLWYKSSRLQSKLQPLEGIDMADTPQETVSAGRILHFLEQAGKRCMDMLTAFYYDKLGLNEIAGRFGFSGTRSATVQKYKCLEKVREAVKEKNLSYADFTE